MTNVFVDGAIGTAVGRGIGTLVQLALAAGSVSLFVASPLVAPLVMLGWGAVGVVLNMQGALLLADDVGNVVGGVTRQ